MRGPGATRARTKQPALRTLTNPYGRGRYTPYPVKDPTAAERVEIAGRAYRAALDGWVRRATTPPRPGGGPPDDAALFSLELAERLGRWSLRWQEAQDNAAKSLADRYQALSDHLGRMSSLEEGRSLREAVKPPGRPVESKPPRSFAEIARFFRPVDERGIDKVVPELVEFERPLNPRGIAVTPAERVEIAGRAYRAILDEAVDRFLASPRAGGGAWTRVRSSTPSSPSGSGTGRTSGGRPRTLLTRTRTRDRRRLVTAPLASRWQGHDLRTRTRARPRSGRTSSG